MNPQKYLLCLLTSVPVYMQKPSQYVHKIFGPLNTQVLSIFGIFFCLFIGLFIGLFSLNKSYVNFFMITILKRF